MGRNLCTLLRTVRRLGDPTETIVEVAVVTDRGITFGAERRQGHLILQTLESFHILSLLLFHGVLIAQLELGIGHTSLLDLGCDLVQETAATVRTTSIPR